MRCECVGGVVVLGWGWNEQAAGSTVPRRPAPRSRLALFADEIHHVRKTSVTVGEQRNAAQADVKYLE